MAYSFVTYTGDGSTVAFSFGTIPLLGEGVVPYETQLVVTVGGITQVSSSYTIDVNTQTITFATAPADQSVVRFTRTTKSDDRYVDWVRATNLNQDDLNLDSDQLFFLTQETLDAAENSIRLNSLDQWDAQNKIVSNVSDGVDNKDAVNLQQLNAAIYGGTPGSVQGQGYINSSDGTSLFTLPSLAGNAASDVNVFKDGERLQPGIDYSAADNVDGTSLNIQITSSPLTSLIEIVWVTGILAASLAEGSVNNDNVVNGTLTPSKLANPGGNQLIINDPSTGPEWRDLLSTDLNRNNTLATALGSISLTALDVPNADISMNTKKLTEVAAPTANGDAVNLQTLQEEIASVKDEINTDQDWAVGTMGGTLYLRYTITRHDNKYTSSVTAGVYTDLVPSGYFLAGGQNTGGYSGGNWGPYMADPDCRNALERGPLGSELYYPATNIYSDYNNSYVVAETSKWIQSTFKNVQSSGGKFWAGRLTTYDTAITNFWTSSNETQYARVDYFRTV